MAEHRKTLHALKKWYDKVFEKLGWMVLKNSQLRTAEVAEYLKHIAQLELALMRKREDVTEADRKNDLAIMIQDVRTLLKFVERNLNTLSSRISGRSQGIDLSDVSFGAARATSPRRTLSSRSGSPVSGFGPQQGFPPFGSRSGRGSWNGFSAADSADLGFAVNGASRSQPSSPLFPRRASAVTRLSSPVRRQMGGRLSRRLSSPLRSPTNGLANRIDEDALFDHQLSRRLSSPLRSPTNGLANGIDEDTLFDHQLSRRLSSPLRSSTNGLANRIDEDALFDHQLERDYTNDSLFGDDEDGYRISDEEDEVKDSELPSNNLATLLRGSRRR